MAEDMESELKALREELSEIPDQQELDLKEKYLTDKLEELRIEIDELLMKFDAAPPVNLRRRSDNIRSRLCVYERLAQLHSDCNHAMHRRWQIEMRIMEIESNLLYASLDLNANDWPDDACDYLLPEFIE